MPLGHSDSHRSLSSDPSKSDRLVRTIVARSTRLPRMGSSRRSHGDTSRTGCRMPRFFDSLKASV